MTDQKQSETTKTERETKTEQNPPPNSTKQTETTKTERETKNNP